MKKILFIIAGLFLLNSCEKSSCLKCKREWNYVKYRIQGGGTIHSEITYYKGQTENFTACGDDIKQAEQPQATTEKSGAYTIDGSGTCSCQ